MSVGIRALLLLLRQCHQGPHSPPVSPPDLKVPSPGTAPHEELGDLGVHWAMGVSLLWGP